MLRPCTLLFLVVFAFAAPLNAGEKPNVVIILTDDLGFSDLGCYGAEIETPVLDRLAANGLRFTQFSNTAKCHSSRVSLLTGRWCRQAGDEEMNRAVTLPEVLGPAGYFNAMSGKWHLSKEPTDFGFDRFFGHLSGATHFFRGDNTFRLNGEPWQVPDSGFYTTIAKVDFALEFLAEARKEEKPWFLYLAFNAPHAPIHPLKEDYEKYKDRYHVGWDVIRERRIDRMIELGILREDLETAGRPDHIPAWDDLAPELREWESKRMAGYAGMIDRVDRELGRLVADLEAAGELENTLIVFFSDNGACPYDRNNPLWEDVPYNPETRWTDSTGWAWARNAPYRFYKQNQFEGGVATPAIFHWPAGIKTEPGAFDRTPAHLVDVLPTVAEIAGAEIPFTFPGREPTPLAGVSLAPILAGGALEHRPPIHFLHDKDRGLRDGDWKIVSFRSGPWELYNLKNDPTELRDLAAEQAERVEKMSAEWHRMTRDVLMAPEREQRPVATEHQPKHHPEWSNYHPEPGRHTGNR
ncbi:MAG: arylsulfatase [Luteolibacter sp.]